MTLKDEHRDLALANMHTEEADERYGSLSTALYWGCELHKSPQGWNFWFDIFTQISNGTYFDVPQQTEEECTAKAKSFMYGLPEDADERKTYPVYSGFIKYFPNAIAEVSHLSYKGNQQHHPDKPLHWDKSKSSDELDALMRHILDEDWVHVAWRALANLERKLTGTCQYEEQTAASDLPDTSWRGLALEGLDQVNKKL